MRHVRRVQPATVFKESLARNQCHRPIDKDEQTAKSIFFLRRRKARSIFSSRRPLGKILTCAMASASKFPTAAAKVGDCILSSSSLGQDHQTSCHYRAEEKSIRPVGNRGGVGFEDRKKTA